jgi:hypothetical protein
VEGFRRIRLPIGQSHNRSGITGEIMRESSGRGTSTMGRRMANLCWILRNQHQAIFGKRMHLMFPGIGHIDFRRW